MGKIKLLIGLSALSCSLTVFAACEEENDGIRSMDTGQVQLISPENLELEITVLVADDGFERAFGFQYICSDVIDNTAILFVFESLRRPSFHMRNVKAALDIAFIGVDGFIADIQRMQPYVLGSTRETYYSPESPAAMALETRAGFFAEHKISPGWRLRLSQ